MLRGRRAVENLPPIERALACCVGLLIGCSSAGNGHPTGGSGGAGASSSQAGTHGTNAGGSGSSTSTRSGGGAGSNGSGGAAPTSGCGKSGAAEGDVSLSISAGGKQRQYD